MLVESLLQAKRAGESDRQITPDFSTSDAR